MVTMVDELFDRQYQAGRKHLNDSVSAALSRLARAVNNAFSVLVKIEYQSPWTARSKRIGCG
jgi:hypothetical protein